MLTVIKIITIVFTVIGVLFPLALIVFGFWLDLKALQTAFGPWGVGIGILIFPITAVLTPFYAVYKFNTWFLVLVTYGGMAVGTGVGMALIMLGGAILEALDKREQNVYRTGKDYTNRTA